MANPPRRTQEQRRRETRRALLDAAGELFAQRGYQAASLDEIASHAGMTRGALHYNFTGKHDLLLALLDERLVARGAQLDVAEADAFAAAMPFDRAFSLLFLEFAAVAARDPEVGAAFLERLTRARRDNIVPAERFLERAGVFDAPTEDLLRIFGALVNGLSIEALAGAPLDDLDRLIDTSARLLLAGLSAPA